MKISHIAIITIVFLLMASITATARGSQVEDRAWVCYHQGTAWEVCTEIPATRCEQIGDYLVCE